MMLRPTRRPFRPWLAPIAALLAAFQPLEGQAPWSDERPDARAPVGVAEDATWEKGQLEFGYLFSYAMRDGNLFDEQSLSPEQILEIWDVTAVRMASIVHRPEVRFAPYERLTLLASVPLLSREMDHLTTGGAAFSTQSTGIGDLEVGGVFRMYEQGARRGNLMLRVSLPTGEIDVADDVSYVESGMSVLPYVMQRGSGSVELSPGLAFLGQDGPWSWGARLGGTVHLNRNARNYRVGDRVGVTGWVSRGWNGWLSTSGRVAGTAWESGRGADPILFFQRFTLPLADRARQAGHRIDLVLGTNVTVPSGVLEGHGFDIELGLPMRQSLEGPQLEMDWQLTAGWSYAFQPFSGAR